MNMRKTLVMTLTVMIMICGSALVFSSGLTSGKGKMSGTITDAETGEPIAGVTVKLYFSMVKAFHKPFPKTNAEGKWKIHFIRKGRWDLDFSKSGYEVKQISFFVDPTPGTKNPPIVIQLKKAEGPTVAKEVVTEIEKAKTMMVDGKYDQAISAMLDILEKNKEESGIDIVYLYIGNCYSLKGDYNKGIEYYKKSLEKFPKNKELIVSIGNAYNNINDHENAMKWFSKLKIDEIGNVDTLYNIGVISYNKGDFEGAAKFFKKTTEIDGNFADGFYQLGMTLTALNKPKEAVTALQKFMELAPDSPNFETAKAIVDAFK